MHHRSAPIPFLLALALLPACSRGGNGDDPVPRPTARLSAPLLLSAGMERLAPGADAGWAASVDLGRLGIDPADVDAYYDLTTPAGEPFSFDIVSRSEGNGGVVVVDVAHARDDGNTPVGGPETMAGAGILPSAPGGVNSSPFFAAYGDGFSRVSLRGEVDREQVLVARAVVDGRDATALVRVSIGDPSAINRAAQPGADYPGVEESRDLYSSNSWAFGLPAVAVSGDRTTVVAYEGDRADPARYERFEMRLQLDHGTGAVTGGASEEASPDSGNWRDHEAAALYNVLALVNSGSSKVSLRLSFDRGATFAQEVVLDEPAAEGAWLPRLAQVAMAADYATAVLFWKSGKGGTTDLVLVEGRPSALDGGGSPTAFAFGAPRVLHRVEGDVTPLLMGAAWSPGGDLAVGYGFSTFSVNPDMTWRSVTQNRCAVRPHGSAEITDTLVDEQETVGKDPSVAVLGSGAAMRVFFAYEAADGVRMAVSADAGRTFGAPFATLDPTTFAPTVLAREQDGKVRVDLLFVAQGLEGSELRGVHWDDFDAGASVAGSLTRAVRTLTADAPKDRPVPGAPMGILTGDSGFRVTELAWLGYDAVLDGDDVVVVLDEVTYDAFVCFLGGAFGRNVMFDLGGAPMAAEFTPAEPPPLAAGLTEPVDAPDPDHMHQLRWMRID